MKTKLLLTTLVLSSALAPAADLNYTGLSDVYESIYFGGPADAFADADGDGVSNFDEMFWGTNPTNATSKVTGPTATLTGGDLLLSWPAAPLRTYQLEASVALQTWQMVTNGSVSSYLVRLSGPGALPSRFYRLQASLPPPTAQSSSLAATLSGQDLLLTWPAATNRLYELQASEDLMNWQTLSANALSPHLVNLSAPGLPHRFYRLKITGGSASGLEPWEEALYTQALGHPLDPTTDTDGDGLPDQQEFQQSHNFVKKDHPAVGLVVFTPLEK